MRTKSSEKTTSDDLQEKYNELFKLAETAPHYLGTNGWSAWVDRLDAFRPYTKGVKISQRFSVRWGR